MGRNGALASCERSDETYTRGTINTRSNSIRMSRRALDEISNNSISFYCGLRDGTGEGGGRGTHGVRNCLTGRKKKLRPNESNTRGNHAAVSALCAANEPC